MRLAARYPPAWILCRPGRCLRHLTNSTLERKPEIQILRNDLTVAEANDAVCPAADPTAMEVNVADGTTAESLFMQVWPSPRERKRCEPVRRHTEPTN